MPDRYALIAASPDGDIATIITDPRLNPQQTYTISREPTQDEARHLLGSIIAADILPVGFDAIASVASLMGHIPASERESYDFTFFDLGVLASIFLYAHTSLQPTALCLKSLLRETATEEAKDAESLAQLHLAALKALIQRLETTPEELLNSSRGEACSYSAFDVFNRVTEAERRKTEDADFIQNIDGSKIKHFLFFDTECSNCDKGFGKICEFGYLVTDTSFNPVEKREFIINPGKGYANDFRLADRHGQIRIHLTYEANNYRYYRLQPELDKFVPALEKLLTRPDTLIFGFSIDNDLRYVDYGFQRYLGLTSIDTPDIAAIDIQQMYRHYNNNQVISLDRAVAEYGQTDDKIRYHRALDDAIATMQAYRNLCQHTGLNPFELIAEVGTASLFTMRDIIDPNNPYRFDEMQKETARSVALQMQRRHREEAKIYPMMAYIDSLGGNRKNRSRLKAEEYQGKRLYFTIEVIRSIQDITPVLEAVERKGYVITSWPEKSDISVHLTRPAGQDDSHRMTLEELLND